MEGDRVYPIRLTPFPYDPGPAEHVHFGGSRQSPRDFLAFRSKICDFCARLQSPYVQLGRILGVGAKASVTLPTFLRFGPKLPGRWVHFRVSDQSPHDIANFARDSSA